MKKFFVLTVLTGLLCVSVMVCYGKESAKSESGEALFKHHCSVCHPDGGNMVNPNKTLHKQSLKVNNIKKARDIISKMRNPGPGMTKFDEKTIPDKDAKRIAEYILKSFK